MKKVLLAAISTASFTAAAAPYVGVEYGIGTSRHDFQPKVTVGTGANTQTRALNPKLDEGILGGFLGYSLTDSIAIELGYSQFDSSDDHETPHSNMNGVWTERNWESSVDAKSVTLSAAFSHKFTDSITAKAKAGLAYTQYATHYHVHDELGELNMPTLAAYSNKTNEIGAMVSVGAEYFVLPQLSFGANVKYQFDSFAQTATFNLGSSYYF